MSPEERTMLSALFDRIRDASANPRDREAEAFIADAVKAQPYAPYLLAQAVLVQEQALKAAAERIEALEREAAQPQAAGSGSFLGGLFGGRSADGSREEPARGPWTHQRSSVPQAGGGGGGPWSGQAGAYGQDRAAQPQDRPGMFGQPGPQAGQGGGFLKGALGAAAGVAGGMLLANSLQGLFKGGNNPLGIAGDTKSAGSEAAATPAAANEDITGGVFGDSSRDAPSYDNASYDEGGYDDGGGDGFDT